MSPSRMRGFLLTLQLRMGARMNSGKFSYNCNIYVRHVETYVSIKSSSLYRCNRKQFNYVIKLLLFKSLKYDGERFMTGE